MENAASHQFEFTHNTFEILHAELSGLIVEARTRASKAVNYELTQLYWHIGKRVQDNVLKSAPDDPICRVLSGIPNCRITDATIDLDPLFAIDSAQNAGKKEILRDIGLF